MDLKQFQEYVPQVVDFLCQYNRTIEERKPLSMVEPGYLSKLLPTEAPLKPESFTDIMKDIEEKIMPGLTNWLHPHFHAYFACAATYPGILAEMIMGALASASSSWETSPACTELEAICLDWLARALGLPKAFLFSEPGSDGGGHLQNSASDGIHCALMVARNEAIDYLRDFDGPPYEKHDNVYVPKLVAYCSSEAHSSTEKAAIMGMVTLRILQTGKSLSLSGETLQSAINEDIAAGLHPFFVVVTLGSTGTTAFDNLKEIGEVVKKLPACWLHCDGAYGANSFLCPEMRGPMAGIENADSLNINCYKWMLVNYDTACMFVRDRYKFSSAMMTDQEEVIEELSKDFIDLRHYSVSYGRRFRSLRLWITLRAIGIDALQAYIRNHVAMAKHFEALVATDDRFEVVNDVTCGLVCFRLQEDDKFNIKLLELINSNGKIHMVPTSVHGRYAIRYAICYQDATKEQNEYAWKEIVEQADKAMFMVLNKTGSDGSTRRFSFAASVPKKEVARRKSNPLNDGAYVYELVDSSDIRL